jgi:hypothetical protein
MFEKRLSSGKKLRICEEQPARAHQACMGAAQHNHNAVSKIDHHGREPVDA